MAHHVDIAFRACGGGQIGLVDHLDTSLWEAAKAGLELATSRALQALCDTRQWKGSATGWRCVTPIDTFPHLRSLIFCSEDRGTCEALPLSPAAA